MNITHASTPHPPETTSDTFEEVDVPAIQAEIQERKLEQLPSENLFSPDVVEHGKDDGVVDTTVSAPPPSTPHGSVAQPQVVDARPGRPPTRR